MAERLGPSVSRRFAGVASAVVVLLGTVAAAPAPVTNAIIVGGVPHALDGAARVVTFESPGGRSVVAESGSPDHSPETPLWADRAVPEGATLATHVRSVVLTSSHTADAAAGIAVAFATERPAHLYIDFDGTIYQTLDLALASRWTGAIDSRAAEQTTIAIALAGAMPSRRLSPDAPPYPLSHPRLAEMRRHPREWSEVVEINGVAASAYGYTDAQYKALAVLLERLAELFPNVAAGPPRDGSGAVVRHHLEDWERRAGVLAQWHASPNLGGPGPGFDWRRLARTSDGPPTSTAPPR